MRAGGGHVRCAGCCDCTTGHALRLPLNQTFPASVPDSLPSSASPPAARSESPVQTRTSRAASAPTALSQRSGHANAPSPGDPPAPELQGGAAAWGPPYGPTPRPCGRLLQKLVQCQSYRLLARVWMCVPPPPPPPDACRLLARRPAANPGPQGLPPRQPLRQVLGRVHRGGQDPERVLPGGEDGQTVRCCCCCC